MIHDFRGHVQRANRVFEAAVGCTREHHVGKAKLPQPSQSLIGRVIDDSGLFRIEADIAMDWDKQLLRRLPEHAVGKVFTVVLLFSHCGPQMRIINHKLLYQ
ncbi:MAG: hypothetical protein AB1744_08265 [Candidatus Zixiibacteriota bacterium]